MNSLIAEITKIPGNKIITLSSNAESAFTIDISETGEFGYQPSHKTLFMSKLNGALFAGGALIIREFLPLRAKQMATNGEKMWLPLKNVYGVLLRDGKWIGLDAETVKECHNTDHKTGLPLPPEPGICFKSFPPEV
ncbi:MAG: hypothetical protein JSR46_04115 [Verrucomicrobia bacterium]|nr:hypothetical protein [Verrucomicrobiota bacterium]